MRPPLPPPVSTKSETEEFPKRRSRSWRGWTTSMAVTTAQFVSWRWSAATAEGV
ncbi:hypothetical protein LINGRAHAP2_LOCUS26990 [Linum grandiflorum]